MKRVLKKVLCAALVFAMPMHVLTATAQDQPPLVLAQSNDAGYRISVMEEQIRQLNGKIEDLNFQLLEMQERMRRMQEDNEFRFQEIEEKLGLGGGAIAGGNNSDLASTETGSSLEKLEAVRASRWHRQPGRQ